jgi:cardiolipin synthase A/B
MRFLPRRLAARLLPYVCVLFVSGLASARTGSDRLLRDVARLGRQPATTATFFEPLREGELAFQRRIQLADSARHTLIGTLYAVDMDKYGFAFVDALTRAAKRGVKVAVGIDRSAQMVYNLRAGHAARVALRAKLRDLEAAGGTVGWYGGITLAQLRRPATGVHYKSLVADGREAITDGRNIGHEYFARWSDFGARVRGPVVKDIADEALRLLGRFESGEGSAKREGPIRWLGLDLGGKRRARYAASLREIGTELAATPRAPAAKAGTPLALVAWDPLGDEKTFWPKKHNHITEALTLAVSRAKHEVTLSSNFVHAGRPLREALKAAARRGVHVRIVTSGRATSEISILPYLVTSAHYAKLVEAGCEIYETTNRMEHGKLYLIDGRLGAYGSYNSSKMSDERNAEALMFSTDKHVVGAIRSALEDTIANHTARYQPHPPRTLGELVERMVQVPLRLLTR